MNKMIYFNKMLYYFTGGADMEKINYNMLQ